jgi:hypothetical protein
MRLKKSLVSSEEQLVASLNDGYKLLDEIYAEYSANKKIDSDRCKEKINEWGTKVLVCLDSTFPTELEIHQFRNPPSSLRMIETTIDEAYQILSHRLNDLIGALTKIRAESLHLYTDLPAGIRLYVEDIDSFRNVRDVNPEAASDLLVNGYWDIAEDFVQLTLEQILDVPFHKKDWGGEYNDLYTANVIINGRRTASAFMLKGNGLKKKTMEIKDCGKNGDQLVRLFESPAQLYVVQFVGNISEAVIKDVEGKVNEKRAHGKDAWYCIITGQDTARLARAYGKA